jgi:tagatose 6-phosphate kinase
MILCIGTTPTMQRTLTFRRLRLNEVNRAAFVDEYASGKGVNVARVATQLGEPALATGFVGGVRGRQLLEGLSDDGVAHDFVRVPAETRLCTTVIDEHRKTVTELVEESQAVPAEAWTALLRKVARHLKSAKVCVMSGSLPPGGDEDFYRDVARLARRQGVPTILDARGRPLLRAIGTDGLLIKLNREELQTTIGRPIRSDGGLRKAMREICPARGHVVVTMGAEGAAAWDGQNLWHAPALKVRVVNPIGSGDAFAAGLAAGIVRGLQVQSSYALAIKAAGLNAAHHRAGHILGQQ